MKHHPKRPPFVFSRSRVCLLTAGLLLGGCSSTDTLYTGLPTAEEKPATIEDQLSELKKRMDVHDQEWQKLKPGIERLLQLEGDLKNLTLQLDQIARAATAAQPSATSQSAAPAPVTTQPPAPRQTAPQPEPQPEPQAAAPAPQPVAAPSTTGRYALHIASFRDPATVEPGWQQLQARYPALLQQRQARVQSIDLGSKRGTYYRLKVGPFADKASAGGLCNKLKTLGNDCVLTTFQGQPLGQAANATTTAQPAPTTAPTPALANTDAYALQLASYKQQSRLQRGWQELQQRFPEILQGKSGRTTSVNLGERGTYYRLKAGPISDQRTAQQLCQQLIDNQANCVVTRFDGQPLTR